MISVDIQQGSQEWFSEKAGKPSASCFDRIVTTKGEPSKQRKAYLYQLAAEAITGQVEQGYQSAAMTAGIEREAESRLLYELITGNKVEQTGFIYPDERKLYGCSPDGVVIRTIGLELKNPLPKTHVAYILGKNLPTDYFQQVQGSLLVTGFELWHFFSNSPGFDPFFIEVRRDEAFIEKLRTELEAFCLELAMLVRKLKNR